MTTAVFSAFTYPSLTLLEAVQAMARNVGIPVPDRVIGDTDRTMVEALDYANRLGEELARRVDWGGLVMTATFSGTGADAAFSLPTDFARLVQGVTAQYGGSPVRPLTRAEWGSLTAVQGSPRYFLLEAKSLRFWPYPALGEAVSVTYLSRSWGTQGEEFLADSDSTVFPSELLVMGLIARWRRQKGMDYADFEAEYEAALAQYADFDDRSRIA